MLEEGLSDVLELDIFDFVAVLVTVYLNLS